MAKVPRVLTTALLACATAGACSLLAPSRDELTGGHSDPVVGGNTGEGGKGGDAGNNGTGGEIAPSGGTTSHGGTSSDAGEGGVAADGGVGGASGSAGAEACEADDPPPHDVLACDGLGAVGTWELKTPPAVTLGTFAFAPDPQKSGVLYLGTEEGLWKTTDCAATWNMVNTGTNGVTVGSKSIRAVLIDPIDPDVIYVKSGDPIYKSTNGGVDWEKIFPSAALSGVTTYDAVLAIDMDRCNSQHLLISLRDDCVAPYTPACMLESHDGGATWDVLSGDSSWTSNAGGRFWFTTPTTWVTISGRGLWRTTNRGSSWQQLADNSLGAGRSEMYRADNGSYYLGTETGTLRSTDGNLWTKLANSGQSVAGLTGDGETLYRSDIGACFHWGDNLQLYYSAPEDNGIPWAMLPAAAMDQGAIAMRVDRDHHVLYSSACGAGFWRVVTE